MSWAAPTRSLCHPHLRPCPRLLLTHPPASCCHPPADVTSPSLCPNFSSGFCSTPPCPTASQTQHSPHCPHLFPDGSLPAALSGSITLQPPNHPSQNPKGSFYIFPYHPHFPISRWFLLGLFPNIFFLPPVSSPISLVRTCPRASSLVSNHQSCHFWSHCTPRKPEWSF